MNDLEYYQSAIDDYVADRARRETEFQSMIDDYVVPRAHRQAEFRAAVAVLAAYAVGAFALGFWTLFLIGMGS